MYKLGLFSTVLATIFIPLLFARRRNLSLQWSRTVITFVVFNVFYVVLIIVVLPRLLGIT